MTSKREELSNFCGQNMESKSRQKPCNICFVDNNNSNRQQHQMPLKTVERKKTEKKIFTKTKHFGCCCSNTFHMVGGNFRYGITHDRQTRVLANYMNIVRKIQTHRSTRYDKSKENVFSGDGHGDR